MREQQQFGYDFEMGRLKARFVLAASVLFFLAFILGTAALLIYLFPLTPHFI